MFDVSGEESDGKKEIMTLRAYMLLFIKQIILKGADMNSEHLQNMLNFIATEHEVW